MLLAIDTSTQIAGIALYREGSLREECTWWSEQNHTTELMPAVVALLARQGITTADLQSIAVALGPGSFNGLRVGISTAKGLAYALGIPLVGVSTLEVLAYPHALHRSPIRPLLPSGRGQVSTALFRSWRGQWRRLEEDGLDTVENLCQRTTRRTLFCGEITPALADLLRQRLGRLAVVAAPVAAFRRAGFLADLAWKRLQAGQRDDPAALQPIYLRRPSIGGVSGGV